MTALPPQSSLVEHDSVWPRRLTSAIAACSLAIGFTGSASAILVHDNGDADPGASHFFSDSARGNYIGARLELPAPALIDRVTWHGDYSDPMPADNFTVAIYDYASSDPAALPLMTLNVGPVEREISGIMQATRTIWAFDASLSTPFSLESGRYLLSIVNDTSGNPTHWRWSHSGSPGTGETHSRDNPNDSWRNCCTERMAFALHGTIVPEPGTSLLIGGGLMALAVRGRRARSQQHFARTRRGLDGSRSRAWKSSVLALLATVSIAGTPARAYQLAHTFDNPSPAFGDQFGRTLDMDGPYIAIGAFGDDTEAFEQGQVYLYNASTRSLIHIFNDPTPSTTDQFGRSIALDGTRIVIGAFAHGTTAGFNGQAHVFDTTTFALLHTFDDPTPTGGDRFGFSAAIEGSTAVIGAPGDDTLGSGLGQAHVFDVTTGSLLYTLSDPTPTTTDGFGDAVAISGPYVLVAASNDSTMGPATGEVHLFDRATGALLHTFYDPSIDGFDDFGSGIDIEGNSIVIGARYQGTTPQGPGEAHLFDAVSGAWIRTFNDPTPGAEDSFGTTVSIEGDRVLIGAPSDSTFGQDVGQAHLFSLGTGLLLHTFDDPTITFEDAFGFPVVLNEGRVLLGAFADNSVGSFVGQAHLFERVPVVPGPGVWLLPFAVACAAIGIRRRT